MKSSVTAAFSRYDAADYLKSNADIAAYLKAAADDGDPAVLVAALGNVAKARNVSHLAREAGLSREGLYKALSGSGNPSFATVTRIAHALGLKITLSPAG
jgi:probable addiction module antidote protein